MGQVIGLDWVAELLIASATSISMAQTYQGKNVRITIGGQQYAAASNLSLNLTITGFGGLASGSLVSNTLYYIYAVVNAGVLGLVASTSGPNSGPTGFASWKEIGRFRTFLGSAGAAAIVNRAGPGLATQPPASTEWATYPATIASANANLSVTTSKFRRVGNAAEGIVSVTAVAGSTGGVVTVTIPPSGLSIDLNTAPVASTIGAMRFFDSGVNNYTGVTIVQTVNSFVAQRDGVPSGVLGTEMNANDAIHFQFLVPIAEWVGLFD